MYRPDNIKYDSNRCNDSNNGNIGIQDTKRGGAKVKFSDKLRMYARAYKKQPTGKEVCGTVEILEKAAEYIDGLNGAADRDTIYEQCIDKYGVQSQIDMCIEEMSELTKALLKYRRKNANLVPKDSELGKTRADIIDELADVKIMCRQMELIFQAEAEVEKRINFKISRQTERLNGKKC